MNVERTSELVHNENREIRPTKKAANLNCSFFVFVERTSSSFSSK